MSKITAMLLLSIWVGVTIGCTEKKLEKCIPQAQLKAETDVYAKDVCALFSEKLKKCMMPTGKSCPEALMRKFYATDPEVQVKNKLCKLSRGDKSGIQMSKVEGAPAEGGEVGPDELGEVPLGESPLDPANLPPSMPNEPLGHIPMRKPVRSSSMPSSPLPLAAMAAVLITFQVTGIQN